MESIDVKRNSGFSHNGNHCDGFVTHSFTQGYSSPYRDVAVRGRRWCSVPF